MLPNPSELDADKEDFVLLALNNKNRINGYKVISTGTLTASLIRPGDVYRAALHLAAAAVVFVHNHPSGDPTPSQADIQMTQTIIDVARPLGIAVHDHIVVGKEGHASFKSLRLI